MTNKLWNLAAVIHGASEAPRLTRIEERDARLDAMWQAHLTLAARRRPAYLGGGPR